MVGKAFPSGLLLRRAALPLLAGTPRNAPRFAAWRLGRVKAFAGSAPSWRSARPSFPPSSFVVLPPESQAQHHAPGNWLRDAFDRVLHRVGWHRLADHQQPSYRTEPLHSESSHSISSVGGKVRVTPTGACGSAHLPSTTTSALRHHPTPCALLALAASGGLLGRLGSAPRTGGAGVNGKNGYP